MMHAWIAGAVFVLSTTGVGAQSADPSVASVRGAFDLIRGNIMKAAAQVPDDMYAFKPTPDVRSMGAQFAHIADANFMICGVANGEKPPMSRVEKTKTRNRS